MSPILGIWASQISGRLWEPQGAYDALSTVTVPSGGAASITFAAIPTGYKHLQIRWISRSAVSENVGDLSYHFNGDTTTSNYAYHRLIADGSAVYAQGSTSSNAIAFVGGNNNTTNVFSTGVLDILDYATTTKNKTSRSLSGYDNNGSGWIGMYSNLWLSTSAVNSISLFRSGNNLNQHSQFTLYGVR
jgi:hypothetical protein